MRAGVTTLLIVLCLFSVCQGSAAPSPATPTPTVGNTIIEIQLQENGDARVSITWTVVLRDSNATAGFETVAREFENGVFLPNAFDPFNRSVSDVKNATGRPMSVRNMTRNASRFGGVGRFEIGFTWKNFGVTRENGRYIDVGDAFMTTHGPWLTLTPEQTLVIRPPGDYRILSATTSQNRSVISFDGPRTIGSGVSVTYVPIGYTNGDGPGGGTGSDTGPVSPLVLAVGTVTLLVLGSLGIFAYSRRERMLQRVTADGGLGMGMKPSSLPSSDPAPDSDPETASESESIPTSENDSSAGSESETHTDDGIDLSLLSDEERIERLLRENDGRMKQTQIVNETGWSTAKVSLLLSSMDEEDRIEKLRIGRENLISLSGNDESDGNHS